MDYEKYRKTQEDFHRRMALYKKERDAWCYNCDLGQDKHFDCYGCSDIENLYYLHFPEVQDDSEN